MIDPEETQPWMASKITKNTTLDKNWTIWNDYEIRAENRPYVFYMQWQLNSYYTKKT